MDETSIFYQYENVTKIENVLKKEFANVCKWFIDNRLSIHFGEHKTKYILFSVEKDLPELNVAYDNNRIKQSHIAEYFGCYLDTNLSGESMAIKFLKKINTNLEFLSRKLSVQIHIYLEFCVV